MQNQFSCGQGELVRSKTLFKENSDVQHLDFSVIAELIIAFINIQKNMLFVLQKINSEKDKTEERLKAADVHSAFITTLTLSFPSRLPPHLLQLIQALKHCLALFNEPEVTSLLRLWQGLLQWKLDDLEVACRCGESGRGVRKGRELAVPGRRVQLTQHIKSKKTVSQSLKTVCG